jgi:hypothetical protein
MVIEKIQQINQLSAARLNESEDVYPFYNVSVAVCLNS